MTQIDLPITRRPAPVALTFAHYLFELATFACTTPLGVHTDERTAKDVNRALFGVGGDDGLDRARTLLAAGETLTAEYAFEVMENALTFVALYLGRAAAVHLRREGYQAIARVGHEIATVCRG